MSIINNVERYMKRYDYLMEKRERRYKHGKRLSQEEDEELRKLRPNVFTPIMMMFELLHDTVKTNQEYRQRSSNHRNSNQTGGALPPSSKSTVPSSSTSPSKKGLISATAESAATAAATALAMKKNPSQRDSTSSTTEGPSDPPSPQEDNDNDPVEARRLSELEESLLPLLTKIIVYIEQNKKAETKKHGEEGEEDEKYPDIGTTAKNSAILVVRRIKKWWNDLISGGTSDLSSKINLKKAIPQLANNPTDMNNITAQAEELEKLAEKATDVIHGPLQKIERILSNDVRDIASSSVEGIMNALSLIPGIGTTLQLWRLLQNVIVIMSKSVTTMAGAKEQGVALKTGVQGLQGEFQQMTDPTAIANKVAGGAMAQAQGALNGAGGNLNAALNGAGGVSGAVNALNGAGGNLNAALNGAGGVSGAVDAFKSAGGLSGAVNALNGAGGNLNAALNGAGGNLNAALNGAGGVGGVTSALKGAVGNPMAALNSAGGVSGVVNALKQGGGSKTNHLRSIKKYRREYKQSIREIKKTRKNILRIVKNMI